jgi:hypothetical protein
METFIKFIFILFILFCSIDVYSQIDKPIKKGNIILGGSTEFSYYPENSDRYFDSDDDALDYSTKSKTNVFTFRISSTFGYFITNGLVLGLSPSFSYYNSNTTDKQIMSLTGEKSESEYKQAYYGIGLSPFIKYYFKNGFFIELNTGFYETWNSSNQHYDTGQNYKYKYTDSSFRIGSGFGYAIFITPKVSIEPGLFYNYETEIYRNKGDNYSSKTNSQFHNISLSVGFQYFL